MDIDDIDDIDEVPASQENVYVASSRTDYLDYLVSINNNFGNQHFNHFFPSVTMSVSIGCWEEDIHHCWEQNNTDQLNQQH